MKVIIKLSEKEVRQFLWPQAQNKQAPEENVPEIYLPAEIQRPSARVRSTSIDEVRRAFVVAVKRSKKNKVLKAIKREFGTCILANIDPARYPAMIKTLSTFTDASKKNA